MTAAPAWSATDDDTADLLSLVAHDQMHPRPAEEWGVYVAALREAADADGLVDPNGLRRLVRGEVAPRRVGAYTNRALAEGLIVPTGDWCVSDDTEGRNAGRPCRVYRLTDSPTPAAQPGGNFPGRRPEASHPPRRAPGDRPGALSSGASGEK